jgi:hypothetical protein
MEWVPAVLLGLGLASSTGLNTFLPLLCLSAATHFNVFGVQLNGSFGWLASGTALAALSVAALVEVVGDKIPVVDHALDAFGTIARPAAGALAAASVFLGDPAAAALVGLVIGAPSAFSFHAAKAGTRAASSATTMGLGNPILSTLEDAGAVALTLLALLSPWLVPVALAAVVYVGWRLLVYARRFGRRGTGTAAGSS